jgi:hypothetical protein
MFGEPIEVNRKSGVWGARRFVYGTGLRAGVAGVILDWFPDLVCAEGFLIFTRFVLVGQSTGEVCLWFSMTFGEKVCGLRINQRRLQNFWR